MVLGLGQHDLMRTCTKSIEQVLCRSRDSTHEYFVAEKEEDLRSQIFYQIVTSLPQLIKPNAPLSIHCEVPPNQVWKIEDRFKSARRELDIAIIARRKDVQNKRYGAHFYDLKGVIEVKRNFAKDVDFHLDLIDSLLRSYPNAFAIFAVMYWPTHERDQTARVQELLMNMKKWKQSRIDVICERNIGPRDHASKWKGEILHLNQITPILGF